MDREYVYECSAVSGQEKIIEKSKRVIDTFRKNGQDIKGFVEPGASIDDMANFLRRSHYMDDFLGASDDLRVAFYLYQGSGYKHINNFLRSNKGLDTTKKETFSEIPSSAYDDFLETGELRQYTFDMVNTIEALDLLIDKQEPLEEDAILYHAGDINMFSEDGNIASMEDLIAVNYSLAEPKFMQYGYLSTTLNISGRFCDEAPIIMAIRVPKGTKVLGPFNGEGEILLGRGYELNFIKSEIMDGKIFVYVDAVLKEKVNVRDEQDIEITNEIDAIKEILKDNEEKRGFTL